MKRLLCAVALLLVCATGAYATSEQQPEAITGMMAAKFGRGVTNIATAVVEIPKQTVLMGRDMGPVGYLVGPFSGLLMTGYRAIVGVTETVFFMVPAPGYYDPFIDPEFVWAGWEAPKRQPLLQGNGAEAGQQQ